MLELRRLVDEESAMASTGIPRRKPPSKRSRRARAGHGNPIAHFFDHFAAHVTKWAGSPLAFGSALILVIAWGLSGPAFGYSETWQLVINTGTTIVTFLMVFLIQQSQNKDGEALHLKLDELLIALKGADAGLVDVERLDEDKLLALAAACSARARSQRRKRTRKGRPGRRSAS
ncbi:low affinity iron permease family protein [Achromobacter sp. UMC71]|uniref:low affinity iron permease family protein n=1 Tax=Achromobacter sp. UMC71 TaxID=1862320 RepID=UPI00210226EF|nr:low affinity iron permease family protein [Achromobacter sp. UMC71]